MAACSLRPDGVGRAGPRPSQLGTPESQPSHLHIDPILRSHPQGCSFPPFLSPPLPSVLPSHCQTCASPKQFFYPVQGDGAERTLL